MMCYVLVSYASRYGYMCCDMLQDMDICTEYMIYGDMAILQCFMSHARGEQEYLFYIYLL